MAIYLDITNTPGSNTLDMKSRLSLITRLQTMKINGATIEDMENVAREILAGK